MQESKSNIVARASVFLTCFNAILLIAVVAATLVIRQRFSGIYADFEAELTMATEMLLSIPGWLWVGAMVILLIGLVAKELIPVKTIPLYLNVAFLVLAVAYSIYFILAMALPLLNIIDEMS